MEKPTKEEAVSDKVKITSIEIQMGDTKVGLTLQQAKDLKDALKEMFPDPPVVTLPVPYYVPIWERRQYWGSWRVTTGGETVSYCLNT